MKNRRILTLFISLLTVATLVGCNDTPVDDHIYISDADALLEDTPVTDSCKFDQDYTNKVFTKDHIGLVKLRSNTDGDTAKFYDTNSTTEFFPLRFLGINTPESTGSIEPWGKKASLFTADKLNNAKEIVLINDVSVFGERDSSGNRYLGFIWYRNDTTSDFRLLNLEIVEQGYSKNQVYDDSTICPYRSYFEQAEENAKAVRTGTEASYQEGLRVQGTKDPGYDYKKTVYTTSIRTLKNNYEDWGVTEESSGKRLLITATVVGLAGNNLYLRDVVADVDDNPNEELGYIYLFSGYTSDTSSACGIGDFISFYCRATTYLESIQLSDLSFASYGKEPFTNITKLANTEITDKTSDTQKEKINAAKEQIKNYIPYDKDNDYCSLDDCNTLEDVAKYEDRLVIGTFTVRNVNSSTDDDEEEGSGTGDEYYYKKDSNSNMTVYSILNKNTSTSTLYINMRIEGGVYPYPDAGEDKLFKLGHTYRVKGFLKPYYEKYQICLFNNDSSIDTYIEEI